MKTSLNFEGDVYYTIEHNCLDIDAGVYLEQMGGHRSKGFVRFYGIVPNKPLLKLREIPLEHHNILPIEMWGSSLLGNLYESQKTLATMEEKNHIMKLLAKEML